ncbi:MAG: M20/M25/M40 family metallo-hydrolase [Trueperaceae bacterium]
MQSDKERVLEQLEVSFSTYVADILTAIRQPSISKTGEGLAEMADWLCRYLEDLGAEVEHSPGQVAPIIYGHLGAAKAEKTLLFYELYDVQPAAEPGWSVPPFAAEIVPDGSGQHRIVGRGAFNSKGPLVGFLGVLKAFRDAGVPLPVNLRFLIEGEEEIGSPSLEPFIRENLAFLRDCNAAFIPYFSTNSRGQTIIRLGFKGLVMLELSVEGGDWGGPVQRDVHAMHSAWLQSPAWELLQALTSLQTESGRLSVDGLDKVSAGPSEHDRTLIADLALGFDRETWLEELGAHRFKYDAEPEDLLTHLMFDPTLNIDAIDVGAVEPGEDPPTVIPHRARAYLDLRPTPGMDPAEVVRLVREHLDRRGFGHVQMDVKTAYPAAKVDVDQAVVQSLLEACREQTDDLVVYPLHAGAAPLHLFSEVVGIPFAFGGVGRGGRSHSPNEYIYLEDLRPFYRSMVSFLFEFGKG